MFNRNKNRKDKTIYGIVGLGRFGTALALQLAEANTELIVLDQNEEKVREMRDYTENAYVVHSLDRKALAETGIQNCDVAIVCIGEQLDVSILTTLHLKSLGIPTVIAKSTSQEHGEILEKLGAEVVYPERDMAIRLANRLEASRMLDYIQLSEKLNISKLFVPEKLIGRTVLKANLRAEFGVNIIAIENDGNLIEAITPDYVFRKGDILFVAGGKADLNRLSDWAE